MADTVSIVNYFSIIVPHKAGESAKVFAVLKDAGVNLTAVWGYPIKGKKAQLDIVPADAKAFQKACKKAGIEVASKSSTLVIAGDDRPGALGDAAAKLGAAGVVIRAAQANAADGKWVATIQVGEDDIKKAKKAIASSK